jgi:hypothetical protein
MVSDPKPLFADKRFKDYKRSQKEKMKAEISDLSSAELENSTDSLELIFSSRYSPSEIQLHEPSRDTAGEVEQKIDRNRGLPNLPTAGPPTRKLRKLKYIVPFSGKRELLLRRPRSVRQPLPGYHELNSNEIVRYIYYRFKNRDNEDIKSEIKNKIEKFQDRLDTNVERLNRDIRKMQGELENSAREKIEEHRENLEAEQEALQELGISTEPVEQGFVKPEKKKELELPDLNGSQQNQSLLDQTFVEILDIIDDMADSVERMETGVRQLDEEELRSVFLGAINTHFGVATGEAFNRGGKTDILLRHQNVNLFVAECKFWRGPAVFHDAADQLLGNLAGNDRHAALLIFSDRSQVDVEQEVENEVRKHSDFETDLSRFQDHSVYRFRKSPGSEVKIATKVVDLTD